MITPPLKAARPLLKNTLLLILVTAAPFIILYLGQTAQAFDPQMGVLDSGIIQLLALSILSFIGINALAWQLLQQVWRQLGLPPLTHLVSHFNQLNPWQQHRIFLSLFALLVLSATGCLMAIC